MDRHDLNVLVQYSEECCLRSPINPNRIHNESCPRWVPEGQRSPVRYSKKQAMLRWSLLAAGQSINARLVTSSVATGVDLLKPN